MPRDGVKAMRIGMPAQNANGHAGLAWPFTHDAKTSDRAA